MIAVLGNHDHHADRCAEVTEGLEAAGIVVLDRSHTIIEVKGLDVGIVGCKGFVGASRGRDHGLRRSAPAPFYRETGDEVAGLEQGLEAIAGCHRRIVLLHYAPISETLVGEPEQIWAFLGSGRLAEPIGAHRPDLVLHGHAHHGAAEGAIGISQCGTWRCTLSGPDFATAPRLTGQLIRVLPSRTFPKERNSKMGISISASS